MSSSSVIETGDRYKDEIQNQWNEDACGSHYVKGGEPGTLDWYIEAEAYRYGTYAPWMPVLMEFAQHRGHKVLEIGAGLGTDLAQFAINGALCVDLDLSKGHLEHAQRNFALRGLSARFIHQDAEDIPFEDGEFDVVYSNGVIHHTPNTMKLVGEIYRVLKPGGKAIIMVYAEQSWHYWRKIVLDLGLRHGGLLFNSVGEIMSRYVELSEHGQKPLVKVYTRRRLTQMFSSFDDIVIHKRQLLPEELPRFLQRFPIEYLQRLMGWNLILKARKPSS